jgi:hypothetical protein
MEKLEIYYKKILKDGIDLKSDNIYKLKFIL